MSTKILPSADDTDQLGQSTDNGDSSNLRWKGIFSDVRVEGDLTVTGTTTTVSSTNTVVSDKLIELGNGVTGTPSGDAGIVVERGDSANAGLIWDESSGSWVACTTSATGSSTGDLTYSTATLVANLDSNSTLTEVKVATELNDSNGNELLAVSAASSAVNHLQISNSATGSNPSLAAVGDDSNVGIDFQLKGTGSFDVHGTSDTSAQIKLYEDTDEGTNYIGLKAAAIATSYTLTLPTGAPNTNGLSLVSNTDGTCSWNTVSAGGLADDSVSFSKMQEISNLKVIGNVSGSTDNPAEVSILDEDNFASDSATALATQQSIKAYVDSQTTDLTSEVTGALPVANGGTGATSAAAARTALDVDQAGTDNSTDVTLATVASNYLSISGQEITSGTVPVSLGGTGATTASAARTALGVDAAGTDNSTNVTLANTNYLSISGQEITGGTVPVSSGGTGATTAAAARTALDVDQAGTDNSTDVTLATVSSNYLSISGQEITAGTVPVSLGGTGATSAAAARTALDVDQAGTDNSTDVTLATVASNYLSLSGQQITAGTVPVSLGGTGATSASAARTALGVDAAGTDNSTNVTLANTNYLSISGQEITGGTVPVSSGGTGATTASAARTALGLAIGSDVQAYDAQLADVAGLTPADGSIIIGDGSNFTTESGATARASLGLAIGTNVQAYDAQLTDIAGLTPADGNIIVGDGTNFVAESGATARASLGLTIGTHVQAYDAQLADIAGLTPTDGNIIVGDGSNFVAESGSTARSSLGLAIGSDVQAYSAQLAVLANSSITATEADYLDVTTPGTTQASKAVTTDSNNDITHTGDLTISGSGNGITINNGNLNVTGDGQISGSFQVNDKLNLSGSVATIGATTLKMDDSLIELNYLGADASSTRDLGLFGRTVDSSTDTYQGLVFDGSDSIWKFFNTTSYPGADNYISSLSDSKLQVDTVIVKRSVPSTSVGASGDKQGMIAFDGSYLYLCSADYDGTSNVWKRVQLSSDTW